MRGEVPLAALQIDGFRSQLLDTYGDYGHLGGSDFLDMYESCGKSVFSSGGGATRDFRFRFRY